MLQIRRGGLSAASGASRFAPDATKDGWHYRRTSPPWFTTLLNFLTPMSLCRISVESFYFSATCSSARRRRRRFSISAFSLVFRSKRRLLSHAGRCRAFDFTSMPSIRGRRHAQQDEPERFHATITGRRKKMTISASAGRRFSRRDAITPAGSLFQTPTPMPAYRRALLHHTRRQRRRRARRGGEAESPLASRQFRLHKK